MEHKYVNGRNVKYRKHVFLNECSKIIAYDVISCDSNGTCTFAIPNGKIHVNWDTEGYWLIVFRRYQTDIECRKTLIRLRFINPNMINHFRYPVVVTVIFTSDGLTKWYNNYTNKVGRKKGFQTWREKSASINHPNNRDFNQGVLHLWCHFGDCRLNRGWVFGADKVRMG